MTREEAQVELCDEAFGLWVDDRSDEPVVVGLRELLITERIARREAEARVKVLNAAVDVAIDAAIADRHYFTEKLRKSEAQVKELEEENATMRRNLLRNTKRSTRMD